MDPQFTVMASPPSELAAAFLQTGITLGLMLVCVYLYARFHKAYFAAWALAWGLYAVRLSSIAAFLLTARPIWLYWHQVLTGLTALALLWAALVFSQQVRWRSAYWLLVLFPPLWSYLAIYRMENFFLAAGPAVLFLSLATMWTGVVFFRHHRSIGSRPAALMAAAFLLWGVHHLDYPFLRARGAWNPWGYYLDIVFELFIGLGILLLVLEDQRQGLSVLSALSGDLQRGGAEEDIVEALLARPLTLPAVTGSAMFYRGSDGDGHFTHGAGTCADWIGDGAAGPSRDAIETVIRDGHPAAAHGWPSPDDGRLAGHAYTAALPVFRGEEVVGALVVVGKARDPFAVLDEEFLIALGHHVGAALANADLYKRLAERSTELERLTVQMVRQHEEERQRLSRELHDETAQVFAAVRLQVALARDEAEGERRARLEQALEFIGSGIRSIRAVARDLRPTLLDDLGLLPALQAQATEFERRTGIETDFRAPDTAPPVSAEAELALFRAMQEGLANVARHSDAGSVHVVLSCDAEGVSMRVEDDGNGVRPTDDEDTGAHMGLVGMRERIGALGGSVTLNDSADTGAVLDVMVPLSSGGSQ
jgi:signal transduction histidine kinase